MRACNATLEESFINEDPLWTNGMTFHHLGLLLSAIFGLFSVIVSLFLVMQHACHYLRPNEQKHIIRILLMVPIYSLGSFLSFWFYRKAVYFDVIQDCYEAFAISSFFTLLCHYVAPDLHEQKVYFRGVKPKNWFLSFFGLQKCTGGENRGPFRKPRSGLTWFNIIWVGIYQYCFIRVFFTIVSVVTEALGVYCEESLSPAFAHVWTEVFECVSVTIAMTMVIQFYIQLKDDIADHRPFLKVLSIKLVIFFSFWQTSVISFISSASGPLQPTSKISYQDIKVGIPAMLLCIEMAFFSVLHIFAYPWRPYDIGRHKGNPLTMPGAGFSGDAPRYLGGPFGLKALLDAANPWDILKASARGFRWLFVGYRHRETDASYQPPSIPKITGMDTEYAGPAGFPTHPPGSSNTELHRAPSSQGENDDRVQLLRNTDAGSAHAYGETDDDDDLNDDTDTFTYGFPNQPPHHLPPPGLGPPRSQYPSSSARMGDSKSTPYPIAPDPDFHPGMGPPPGSNISTGPSGEVHPAHRPQTPQGVSSSQPQGQQGWNLWAGASRDNAQSEGRYDSQYAPQR